MSVARQLAYDVARMVAGTMAVARSMASVAPFSATRVGHSGQTRFTAASDSCPATSPSLRLVRVARRCRRLSVRRTLGGKRRRAVGNENRTGAIRNVSGVAVALGKTIVSLRCRAANVARTSAQASSAPIERLATCAPGLSFGKMRETEHGALFNVGFRAQRL